ncbi:MAG TPA: PHP domain-containing protein, partial [Beijerinckiaceae bacterium]|nr:PHP domain-containing protein [Beijerinckiaceae bacterium]
LDRVGAALADTIERLHRDGTTAKLEALRAQVPAGALDLLRVPGLKPQKILQLVERLGIDGVEALERACREGRVAADRKLGPALQASLLDGIALMRASEGLHLIHRAADLLGAAEAGLRAARPDLTRVAAAGDFRRGCELVRRMALVAQAPERGIRRGGGTVEIWTADAPRYGVALALATGSPEHVRGLQEQAAEKGFRLDQKGLFRGRRLVPCPEERDLYAALGLAFVEPELREGRGELDLAAAGRLPNLVRDEDLRGLLHCHTVASDGGDTLEAMAEATRRRGYSYLGIADHSRSAAYAGGLSIAQVAAQQEEIDALNAAFDGAFRIFKGIESDILEDGSLDYPDEVLETFDFVVASVHGRFRLDETAQTARIVRAVENPFTTILGHMTGRLLLRREGYRVDVEAVLRACAANDVAVEVNANPHRLDLDWRWHARALELGCRISINPDAHSTDELDLTRWGVLMARKGGVPAPSVLNASSAEELDALFAARRARRGRSGPPARGLRRLSARPPPRR